MQFKKQMEKWSLKYGISMTVLEEYLNSLELHKRYVTEFGIQLGVNKVLLNTHDDSKFTEDEFPVYAKNFHGGGSIYFPRAYHHHLIHNPHHWQHWLIHDYQDRNGVVDNGAIVMPAKYALEMIADWHGANKTYTGNDSIQAWLDKNYKSVILHSHTRSYVERTLKDMGYDL